MKRKDLPDLKQIWAKSLGWKHVRGSLFHTPEGSKRVLLTHHEGSWFGLGFGTWDSIKKDETSEVHLIGGNRSVELSRATIEISIPFLSQSEGHYNLNITKDGSLQTTKGAIKLTARELTGQLPDISF